MLSPLWQILFQIRQPSSVSSANREAAGSFANPHDRHRRTHEAHPDGGEIGNRYSDEDLELEENDFGALEEESPPPEQHNNYIPSSMATMAPISMRMQGGMPTPSQMISTNHLLQQPI